MATSTGIVSGVGSGKKITFAAIGILILVGAGYAIYIFNNPAEDTTTAVVTTQNAENLGASVLNPDLPENAKLILDELEVLKKIKPLDTKFFQDPSFSSLKETIIIIPPIAPTPGRVFSIDTGE
jgi:hypothetical protein